MSSDILLYSCYRYSKFYRKKLLQVARCILHASTRLPDGERTGQDRTGFLTLTRSYIFSAIPVARRGSLPVLIYFSPPVILGLYRVNILDNTILCKQR